MKTAGILLVAFALLLVGCNNRAEQLEKEKAGLQEVMKSKDEFIQAIMARISEVHRKLETAPHDTGKAVTVTDRQRLMRQMADIDASLSENKAKLADLETKLKSSRTQGASLNTIVGDLKQSLEERQQAIAQLNERVKNLETELREKTTLVEEKDAIINQKESRIKDQIVKLNTAYYVIGKKDDLQNKGIIRDEGGFLWGLIGSTTVLASGFDNALFKPIDKSREMSIEVGGKIEELVPERDKSYYAVEQKENNLAVLRIVRPDYFWQQNHLVIVTK
jgi:DNA repair exonuclease SbcCD ATPase subunit